MSSEVIDLNEIFKQIVEWFKPKAEIVIKEKYHKITEPEIIEMFRKLSPTQSYFIGGTKHETFDRLIVDPHLIHHVSGINYIEKEHYSYMGDIVMQGLKVQLYKFYEVERTMNE